MRPASRPTAKGNVYYTWIAKDGLPYLAVSRDDGKNVGRSR